MSTLAAHAKINLALVVGPLRPDGKHEVTTVLQRISLTDEVAVERASDLRVEGFTGDTLVTRALTLLAEAADVEPRWAVRIGKGIPVAAGLGGGSADAAAALRLANETLDAPLSAGALHAVAASVGADVPFFLAQGPQLGEGDGGHLTSLDLPQGYTVVLLLPHGATKSSTAAVYASFDARNGPKGYERRRARLLKALAAGDLVGLPPNDLGTSPLADELQVHGAFRADLSGAGPAVYGLFGDRADADAAAREFASRGRIWVVTPAW
jgi:4-diphosphocytidyl-2-C-methyl-D-erythritol kinase